MGGGEWFTDVYDTKDRIRSAAGRSAFDHDAAVRRLPRDLWKVHPTLDPKGVRWRESRDSADHPTSLAIAALFDVTGSMGSIPVQIQKKLPELNGLLIRKGYVEHPQIMFGAIGDATCDKVPLQVGQFESDNRMDENLENIILEGGGGGQMRESYELAMYFMARHTDIDCWNKRRQRGYLFVIGDEMAYDEVKRAEVQDVIGDILQESIKTASMVAQLRQKYDTYYILPSGSSNGGNREVLQYWKKLLGQNVIELDNPEAVCETIALQIGITEGTTDLDEGKKHLTELGVPRSTINSVGRALALRNNLPVRGSINLPGLINPNDSGEPKTKRL